MDRSSTIDQASPASKSEHQKGLAPYVGPWSCDLAAHLLRRTTYGPTYEQIKQVDHLGLEATLDLLFRELPMPDPPVNYYYDDPYVAIGKTWINAPYSKRKLEKVVDSRYRSLKAWTMSLILEEGISIREKLTLFWHNHFAIGNLKEPKYLYRYISTLRSNAWGNFRDLVKKITIDPAMLRFLNGYQNTATAPNENYGRELLELFTIGKGPSAGPGDYTTFTEDDVIQVARILTGWQDTVFQATSRRNKLGSKYIKELHDQGKKELSYRFNNACVTNGEDQEYVQLIELIFQQPEVARFICRKLYRWFVHYSIDDQIEARIIEPMAHLLMDHDFEIKPVLLALLRSEHFFDSQIIGSMIKNPLDFYMSVAKTTHISFPEEFTLRYRVLNPVYNLMKIMQMDYYNPPDVAGWKAYYQEPLFYRTWINTANLPVRAEIADRLALVSQNLFGFYIQIDVLNFIATLDNPLDPNQVIEEITSILLPIPLPRSERDALKDVLLSGLPDFAWTTEYKAHLAKPEDEERAKAIERKLRFLLKKIISLPEFNLS